jgi:nucleoid-associated protein YgaU
MIFRPTSRYFAVPAVKYAVPNGPEVAYLQRRFLPPAGWSTVVAAHTVTEGDRLDNITARYLGDPEQFWRLCDANNALDPYDLTAEIGRRLKIPLPQ